VKFSALLVAVGVSPVSSSALVIAAGTIISVTASARDVKTNPAYLRAMSNLAHEYAICIAFHGVVAQCLTAERNRALKAQYETIGGETMARGTHSTAEAHIKPETFVTRMQMAISD